MPNGGRPFRQEGHLQNLKCLNRVSNIITSTRNSDSTGFRAEVASVCPKYCENPKSLRLPSSFSESWGLVDQLGGCRCTTKHPLSDWGSMNEDDLLVNLESKLIDILYPWIPTLPPWGIWCLSYRLGVDLVAGVLKWAGQKRQKLLLGSKKVLNLP